MFSTSFAKLLKHKAQKKGFTVSSREYLEPLGHPRVTVARQSDWALFALGLNRPS
jgi:hypothetical protein